MIKVIQGSKVEVNAALTALHDQEDTVEVIKAFTDVVLSCDEDTETVVVTMVIRITPYVSL